MPAITTSNQPNIGMKIIKQPSPLQGVTRLIIIGIPNTRPAPATRRKKTLRTHHPRWYFNNSGIMIC
ncbi:hypothetical protein [Chitinophaga sp. Cy-1792]|uniref:hypothetical protein n=1 Tax=Chitinophaga sp. Cy-1792 TaxID=2608339 RepID=UPI0014225757|nr:hypothetical protein [Chitinophaga sp. Cy-1792]NIG54910.1 hypothetical protein [Chitinophaga sp. Cy-1792]